ncbi:hypothetical protein [Caballeronia zhejiangensis]|uniref:hypothetical protein n=1 Tax=Caballeronia zhejiangensis TaxID=871203 RepID=UPI0015893BFF|nr:hypothetical protein [Caballeronia zhejiangensis]
MTLREYRELAPEAQVLSLWIRTSLGALLDPTSVAKGGAVHEESPDVGYTNRLAVRYLYSRTWHGRAANSWSFEGQMLVADKGLMLFQGELLQDEETGLFFEFYLNTKSV